MLLIDEYIYYMIDDSDMIFHDPYGASRCFCIRNAFTSAFEADAVERLKLTVTLGEQHILHQLRYYDA